MFHHAEAFRNTEQGRGAIGPPVPRPYDRSIPSRCQRRTLTATDPRRAPILSRLAGAPERLAEAARACDATDAIAAPPEGAWSAVQNVGHLCRLETEVLGARLDSLEAADPTVWRWTELQPGDEPWMASTDTAVAEFAARRAATLARVASLDEPAWARTGTHETFGPLDVLGLLEVFADHDDHHMAAMTNERSRSQQP